MTHHCFHGFVGLLLLVGLGSLACAASLAKNVTLTDYIGVAWTNELVHDTLTFAPHALKGVATACVTGGEDGYPMPAQRCRTLRGRLHQVDERLVHGERAGERHGDVYHHAGQNGSRQCRGAGKNDAGQRGIVHRRPPPIGIRLWNGAKHFDWPAPAAEVPGPIQGLLLPSGRVTGSGQLHVPFHVRSVETEITATGPLFAEARVHYQFTEGYWTFTARVVTGSPLVRITEDLDTGWNAQNGFKADRFYTFTVNGEHFQPSQAFYLARNNSPEYQTLMPPTPQDIVLTVSGSPTNASNTVCGGFTPTAPTAGAQDYGLIGWPCWSMRVGVGIRYLEPGKDAVGFVALNTPYWRNQMAIRFRREANGAITANLPLQVYEQEWDIDGYGRHSPNATGRTLDVPEMTARRAWGIMLTSPEDETKQKCISLLNAASQAGAWPLDTVKDWTLDWPDPMAKAAWAPESSKPAKEVMAQVERWIAAKRAFGNFGIFSMHDYFLVSVWDTKKQRIGRSENPTERSHAIERG